MLKPSCTCEPIRLTVCMCVTQQRQLTGQSLECMRPAGKVKLERIETGIFQERLKHQTPRQVDLNFEALINKFHEKQRQHEELVAREKDAQAVSYTHLTLPTILRV